MIDPAYVQRMARYNRWQNANLYGVADTLSDEERRRERGAFFGSIHKTLSHLLWADRIWMSRFTPTCSEAAGRHSGIRLALSGLGRPEAEACRVRRYDDRLGGRAGQRGARRRAVVLLARRRARHDGAEVVRRDSHVQSSDAPSRTGALHADAGGRQAAHDRPARPAGVTMSDIATLEQQIGGAIAAASDEAALESVRVSALGKSGSVSALLKTLGCDDAG